MTKLHAWILFFAIAFGVIVTCVLLWPSIAGAATCTYPVTSCATPVIRVAKVAAPPVTTTTIVHPVATALPFTGADISEMAVIGAGMLITGIILVRRDRPKPRSI